MKRQNDIVYKAKLIKEHDKFIHQPLKQKKN